MKTVFFNNTLLLFIAIILTTYADIQAQSFPNEGNLKAIRLRIQSNLALGNGWQRGMISQNISYNLSTKEWAIPNNPSSLTYNDFAMMKFSNNGVISFYTRAVNANSSNSFDNWTLENSYKRMTILNNGNVGIGVIPQHKLHVNGDGRIKDIYIGSTPQGGGFHDGVSGLYNLHLNAAKFNGVGGNVVFLIDGSQEMVLNPDGNLGIGTTSPDNKLDVNGTIRAKEIIVETGWSDYVFYDDYQLPTLEEEEGHIKAKGHLIGFESEAAMGGEAKLGDVAKRQQAKIEEMMLHLIEMKKEIVRLKEENEQQKEHDIKE